MRAPTRDGAGTKASWRLPDQPGKYAFTVRARLRLEPGYRIGGDVIHVPAEPYGVGSEDYVEARAPAIQTLAAKSRSRSGESDLSSLLGAVHEALRPASTGPRLGAKEALAVGYGDCAEHADLLVALCRASGVPARSVSGLASPWGEGPQHAWVEVKTSDERWKVVDPYRQRFDPDDPVRYVTMSLAGAGLRGGNRYGRVSWLGEEPTYSYRVQVRDEAR
ncbi:MAG: transglutaminase-like domain-containing protein [bacterium]|nr:transglutaminase-like domain-containing protein [bacterium]